MRKGIMIAGGVILAVGLIFMFIPVFQGITTPIGQVGVYTTPYVEWGAYLLFIGIIIMVIGGVIPSPKPSPTQPAPVTQVTTIPSQLPHTPTKILAICPKCKTRIPSESKFCPECGTNLTSPQKRTRRKKK